MAVNAASPPLNNSRLADLSWGGIQPHPFGYLCVCVCVGVLGGGGGGEEITKNQF